MSVKVIDLLDTKIFSDAQVVAGKNGLSNTINRISFNDCEIREDELINLTEKHKKPGVTMPGDFFVSSLYLVKDDLQKMKDYFRYFVLTDSAGMCIINEYVETLPNEIIQFADDNNFPVIAIDSEVPYADIIQTTMEMILFDQSNTIAEMRIDRLIDRDISKSEVIQSARHINGHFSKFYSSVYFKSIKLSLEKGNLLYKNLIQNDDFTVISYKDGYLIILNHDKTRILEQQINYISNLVKDYTDEFKMGISNTFSKIELFNVCVRQCISAFEISDIIGKHINYYKDLNVYKILYPLKSSKQLEDFHKEIYEPLFEYDEYYKSDLIITLKTYLKYDGDYKKTAECLHQHSNTIRYRILKAKKILDLENNHFNFIEQISIAFKIHKILYSKK